MFVQVIAQFAAGFLLRFRGSKPTEKFEAIQNFDIERFLGTWYLAAYVPPPFQKKLNSASTEYSRSEDGTIKVTNRNYDGKKGRWKVEDTVARFHDSEKIGWFLVDSTNPLDETRKIIYLDDDYSKAIVVGRIMRTLWITYRDPHLEKKDLDALISQADELGFKIRQLVRVDQTHEWEPDSLPSSS